ncbi:MAG: biopolymer transporter ExbD [Proteobacteria bacterium]|nr:biopolymer transporter ExbD [Pseudomonadota bacterium]
MAFDFSKADKAREEQRHAEMEKALTDRIKAKRKAKRSRDTGKTALGLNSMMDMMTIILVFLLKSYGEEPIVILPNTDVPISVAENTPEDMTVITVNKEGIFMVRTRILEIEDGKVNGNFKKGGESGLIIEPLEAALRQEVEKLKSIAMANGKEFGGDMTIIADQKTNYRLLVEVMQTAIGTEFKRFRFAVIQGSMKESGRYASAPELP